MKVFALGTGGFIPTAQRETSCYLVRRGSGAILLDAGTGVANLARPEIRQELSGVDRLDVIPSHLHLDHIGGLTWLLRLWVGEIVIHVPTAPLIEADGVHAVSTFTSPPYFSLPMTEWPQRVTVVPLASRSLTLPSGTVSVMPQRHSGGSVALRLGGLGFVTDTFPGEEHVGFLRGADLLLIDTMHDRQDYESMRRRGIDLDHGYSTGNAELADRAGIRRLGLVHIDPSYDDTRVGQVESQAREAFPGAFVPSDCSSYVVADS